jgi:hypothetical protein
VIPFRNKSYDIFSIYQSHPDFFFKNRWQIFVQINNIPKVKGRNTKIAPNINPRVLMLG